MRVTSWFKRRIQGEAAASEAKSIAGGDERLTHRAFLKGLVAAVGGALVAPAVMVTRKSEAAYVPGTPSDTVDTNLTVQGNLIVNQSTGIGTSTPQGKLHVAGDVWVGGTQAIGTDGVVKESYYAQ